MIVGLGMVSYSVLILTIQLSTNLEKKKNKVLNYFLTIGSTVSE